MSKDELDRLTRRGKMGILTVPEQMLLAAAFDEYRQHAIRLERAVHDAMKKLEEFDLEAEDIDNQINLRLKAEQELKVVREKAGLFA